MDIKITPKSLYGKVTVPPSKSLSHRALICAALSEGESKIDGLLDCEDTRATIGILTSLGASIKQEGNETTVTGICERNRTVSADCGESGSTLRFLMPIASALGADVIFSGRGKLPQRPVTPYLTQLPEHGVKFHTNNMPYHISGQLTPGSFSLAGNISSQFVSGLMFALPLLCGDSEIKLTSPLESKPYADMTIDVIRHFGVEISEVSDGYYIRGNQHYHPASFTVEGDMSQAAFFLVANELCGNITLEGVNPNSIQGDRAILDIIRDSKEAFDFDASQCPDLVPILAVLATFREGVSHITGCERLRIKECDRLAAVTKELNTLGAKIQEHPDSLIITGVNSLTGGVCDSHNDHRIAMSLAIASQRCTNSVTIIGAECTNKSYPDFWKDFSSLGGSYNVIDLQQ